MRALPAVVAVVIVLSTLGGAAAPSPESTPSASPADGASSANDSAAPTPAELTAAQVAGNVSNRSLHVLDIPSGEVDGSTTNTHVIDLGPALNFDANETGYRLKTLATVERIESAPTTDARQRLLLGEVNRIEQRVISLRSAQAETIAAYGDGDISSRVLLLRLAAIDAEARALDARRERLAALASETSGFDLDGSRLASLGVILDTFTGPVRSHVVSVVRGDAPATRFSVSSGDDSVVLTVLEGNTWVREAYRGDLRGTGFIEPEDAENATARSYPLIWQTKQNSTGIIGSGGTYLVRVSHRQGSLAAFVTNGEGDGDTARVFKEFQRRPLSSMASGEAITDVRDGLRLTVNRSHPGAPLRVRLTEAATGDPVDANITVGLEGGESDLVGATGPDGELWTLTPRGETTVTAIRGNSVVIVSFDPAPIPHAVAPAGSDGANNSTGGGNPTSVTTDLTQPFRR